MAVRDAVGTMGAERHNPYPCVRITANLTEDTPLGEAKPLCETLGEQAFATKQLKLMWPTRGSRARRSWLSTFAEPAPVHRTARTVSLCNEEKGLPEQALSTLHYLPPS